MAENEQSQEKTEEPTQRRLEKAREDGEVLSSKEMMVFASAATSLLIIAALGFFSKNILDAWGSLFIFGHPDELFSAKLQTLGAVFRSYLLAQLFLVFQPLSF